MVLGLLALMKPLYWWVESTLVVTSWRLAYLVTWTTCLASHLLQAAFEHTARLAQAQTQEAEPQEAESLFESSFFESLVLKAGPILPERESLGE